MKENSFSPSLHRSRVDEQNPSEYFLAHQQSIDRCSSSSPSSPSKSVRLRTSPSDLLLFPLASSIGLTLFNDDSSSLIFKLKTTEPEILLAQPARGFIPSHSFLHCHLTPIDRPDGEGEEEIALVIQYARTRNEFDDYRTQWNQLKSTEIELKRCPCLFTKPSSSRPSLLNPLLFSLATLTLLTSWILFKR